MYLEDLEKQIKNRKDINFIAMAITPYQAIGVKSAIKYLIKKGYSLSGYILLTAHPNTGRVLKKEHFPNIPSSLKCVDFEYQFREKKNPINKISVLLSQIRVSKKNKGNNIFFFVWTEVVNNILYLIDKSYEDINLAFIKIDDGVASYLSPYECRLGHYLNAAKDSLLKKVIGYFKASVYALQTSVLENNLRKRNQFIDACVFVREPHTKKLRKNEVFSAFYHQSFRECTVDRETLLIYEDSVVINSQGLGEFGITDGKVDIQVLSKIAELLNHYSLKTVLKPHPREKKLEKYAELGWAISTVNVAQEVILSQIQKPPKCIISFYSSTLLNAKGLFNIPVISIAKIMLNENITDTFRSVLENYIKMYDGIVLFPESYKAFENVLKSIKEGK